MAHTCGINSKEFSDLLKQIQLSPEKLNNVTKVSNVVGYISLRVCYVKLVYLNI